MKLLSDKNFPNPLVGDTVRVRAPQVDHGKTDVRIILISVIEVTEDRFIGLGTRDGILKQLYSRSQFQLYHGKFSNIDIPSQLITLRFVASF